MSVLIGLLLTGIFFASLVKSSQPQAVTQLSPSPIPTSASPGAPDAVGTNWKTYKSSKYKFEIKYSSNATAQVEEPGYPRIIYQPSFTDQSEWFYLMITVFSNSKNQTAEEYFRNFVEMRRKGNNLYHYNDIEAQKLNNKRAQASLSSVRPYINNQLNGIIADEDGVYSYPTVIYALTDRFYQFQLVPELKSTPIKESQRKLFDQILSTFRFVE